MTTATATTTATELSDLLGTLALHRGFLRHTARDLTDEQARQRPTASELCVGGLIKHVAETERSWLRFAIGGAELMEMPDYSSDQDRDWGADFRMVGDETLEGLLAAYEETARETERALQDLDLNTAHRLPEAPWFESGASWTVRRVLLHLIAETSQHAGHADIIRESIDGQKTMG
ncbi:DinB family protein [Saccharothrix lopnurensis]|uniref:DinB family protein n=1 Tax=Saccharothrix lopnurensis TaxID=1670621 RepID=A0ABW1P5J3_9PSEU